MSRVFIALNLVLGRGGRRDRNLMAIDLYGRVKSSKNVPVRADWPDSIKVLLRIAHFSAISAARSQAIIRFLSKQKTIINRAAGGIMLTISLYYLIFVFRLFSFISSGAAA